MGVAVTAYYSPLAGGCIAVLAGAAGIWRWLSASHRSNPAKVSAELASQPPATEAPHIAPLSPFEREHRLRDRDHILHSLPQKLRQAQEQLQQEVDHQFQVISQLVAWGKPVPPLPTESHAVGPFVYGVCHLKGRRESMEDEHIAGSIELNILGVRQTAHIFGILDGHDGVRCAQFVKEHLLSEIQTQITKLQTEHSTFNREEIIWNALKMAFVALSENYSGEEGTTATVAMVVGDELWVANCGDSRTILNANSTPIQMTEDMKPALRTMPRGLLNDSRYYTHFTKRIIDRGGYVFGREDDPPRVEGIISTCGAIGDRSIHGISARPVITMKKLSELPEHTDLILCCDGITDVGSTREIAAVRDQLPGAPSDQLARIIVTSAFGGYSMDNLSCLVVRLK